MKNPLKLTIAFLLFTTILNAQQNPNRKYFDKDWKPVTDESQAEYYRETERQSKGWKVSDFFINGQPQMIAQCSDVSPNIVKHGSAIFYYKNGNKQKSGNYRNDFPVGLFHEFYEDGTPQSKIFYGEKEVYYRQYWDTLGNPMLTNGNGFTSRKLEGSTTNQEIKDSVVVNSYNIKDGTTDTVYIMSETIPEYVGGYEKMMLDIRENMSYPTSARRKGISGTVYVNFVIDKTGKITKAYVLRGIHPECDQEALKAVNNLGRWSPGTVHNRPVAVRFNLPIKFRLR